jgi:hypothetical protein
VPGILHCKRTFPEDDLILFFDIAGRWEQTETLSKPQGDLISGTNSDPRQANESSKESCDPIIIEKVKWHGVANIPHLWVSERSESLCGSNYSPAIGLEAEISSTFKNNCRMINCKNWKHRFLRRLFWWLN